jgi:hypothetical protein
MFDPQQRRKDYSSRLCVQTGTGAHPAACTMDAGVLSPGVKRGRGVTLTTHAHLVPRSRMSRSYTSFLPKRFHGVWWNSFCMDMKLDLSRSGKNTEGTLFRNKNILKEDGESNKNTDKSNNEEFHNALFA